MPHKKKRFRTCTLCMAYRGGGVFLGLQRHNMRFILVLSQQQAAMLNRREGIAMISLLRNGSKYIESILTAGVSIAATDWLRLPSPKE